MANFFSNLWNRFFPNAQPLPPGIHSYQSPADAKNPLRMHLRIEPDGSGLLILNASTVAKPINASDNILVGVGSTMNVVVQAAPATGLCPFAKGDVIRVKGYLTK